ncbi:hypothetical protein [Methylobacterium oryzihabitans]|uniref:Uncharacterized protein n=1 Tax=Methylobacterium oryzihabitans TaxID=2499852 RepID=A0A3S2VNQ4_9HYPH|nr:hypothetical protein [Methylobacterium oryzihabitans]RVU17099.1 hypothetical protein EOE48_14390 [Methylobacterium oryzihabitans]
MASDDTLAQALADVSEQRAALEAEYERISMELTKLRQAEAALRAIVENTPLSQAQIPSLPGLGTEGGRGSRRGSRGPRANSAKGRLRQLLQEAGPQGLTPAQIMRALPDASPATVNAYLSAMTGGGELRRVDDFYVFTRGPDSGASENAASDSSDASDDE